MVPGDDVLVHGEDGLGVHPHPSHLPHKCDDVKLFMYLLFLQRFYLLYYSPHFLGPTLTAPRPASENYDWREFS
jgi:hypothetical protein